MSKKYYVRRWVILDNYYNELVKVNKLLENDPSNIYLIGKKLLILQKIKYFLRYRKDKYNYYKS